MKRPAKRPATKRAPKGARKPAKKSERRAPKVKMGAASSTPAEPSAADRKVAVTVFVPKPRTRKEIVEAICRHIIAGERIHKACELEGISWPTLWNWKAEDAELLTLYMRAREASAESFEDKGTQAVEGLTDNTPDVVRIKENHYRWRAKMANPKAFGEKLDVTSAGERLGLEELVAGSMQRTPDRG